MRRSNSSPSWFEISSAREKISELPAALKQALALTEISRKPLSSFEFGRDIAVVPIKQLPAKKGFATIEGQARLLHDLANIELQAMELGVRTLIEFPEAPPAFREQLADITLGEGRHFQLCLDGIEALGFRWGHWTVHTALLDSVSHADTLLDRILIVHRYLEGSGLDAGAVILSRLAGVRAQTARSIVSLITNEEVDHVRFGSDWYHKICVEQKINAADDFAERVDCIAKSVPRRERIASDLRLRAGFTEFEINHLKHIQANLIGAQHL